MDATANVQQQRKKLGRPPKSFPTPNSKDNETNVSINVGSGSVAAVMQTELGSTAALVAISPNEQPSGVTAPAAQLLDTSGECRRSSRKKIIKFDVRDLLNKHRKPHKIQIEARIDSNAPSASSKSGAALALENTSEKNATNNKEKCFIEKTSIIQRSMAFEHAQHGPTQVPIPLKTEIFKPNQASSLIVAQMESVSSSNKLIKKPITLSESIGKGVDIAVVPKRRGRPPKNRSLIEKTISDNIESGLKMKMTHAEESSEAAPVQVSAEQTFYMSASETEKFKEESEVASPDLFEDILHKSETSQQDSSPEVVNETNESKNVDDIRKKFTEGAICFELPTAIESEIEENAKTAESAKNEVMPKPPASITDATVLDSVSAYTLEAMSDENIVASSVESEPTAVVEETVGSEIPYLTEEKLPIESKVEPNTQQQTKSTSSCNITLPLKKQLSKLQELQDEINKECLEQPATVTLEQHIKPTLENVAIKEQVVLEIEAQRKTSTPTQQRSERRSGRRLADGANKTLEETFAEIAANSTKAILEQNVSETSSSEELMVVESTDIMKLEEEQTSSRTMSPKEQTPLDPESMPQKRRGRPPKPKVVTEEMRSKFTVEQEQKTQEIAEIINFNAAHLHIEEATNKQTTELEAFASSTEKIVQENENQNLIVESQTPSKILTEDSLTQISVDPAIFSTPEKTDASTTDTGTTSTEKIHKETKMQKKVYEESTISKKHRKQTSHEQKSSKHRTSSAEKPKKHKNYDKEEESRRKDRSSTTENTSIKSKSSMSKTPLTEYVAEKAKDRSDDENAKKTFTKDKTAVDCLRKSVLLSSEDETSEFDDVNKKSSKKSSTTFKEKFTTDSFKKSSITTPERVDDAKRAKACLTPKEKSTSDVSFKPKEHRSEEIIKKSEKIVEKQESNASSLKVENVKKSSEKSTESFLVESAKKSSKEEIRKSNTTAKETSKKLSSNSKERTAAEILIKKSHSINKDKSTEERKTTPLGKEKLIDDSLRKSLKTKERAFDAALLSTSASLEKKRLKKKHKRRSLETPLSADNLERQKMTPSNSSHLPTTPPPSATKESSAIKVSSSKKTDDSSHKRKRKHKDTTGLVGESTSKTNTKTPDTSERKSSLTPVEHKNEASESAKKQARKERQKKLKEAFKAALEMQSTPESPASIEKPLTTKSEESISSTLSDIVLPPTPGDSDVVEQNVKRCSPPAAECAQTKAALATESATVVEPDPLYDIEKFIEAGVNLLKRDYKLAEDELEAEEKLKGIETQAAVVDEKSVVVVVEQPLDATDDAQPSDQTQATETTLPGDAEDLALKSALDFYETPADTPTSTTPASLTPSSSPIPTDNSVDTYYYSDGVRRSHRLKKIINAPKALVGRGLVRDRDRERLALRDDVETKSFYSIEDHLMDLAEVEAKNAKFLKEMEERLSNFEVIKENEYHCERLVSREARKMICDCFLTPDEAERGELGCGEDCLNRLLMIECGANCKVGERCTNNRFHKHLCAPCRVFRTEKKGFGIMADVEIHPGEFIMEYVGEVLDSEEFEERRVAYSQDKNRHYYFMALRSDAIIDATIKGNISRFINHSCDPNAETQKWTVNGELRIGFFSRKTIMPGEEITFDYQYQRYGREAQRCYCESANCRGWIGEEPASDEGEQVDDDDEDDDDEDEFDEDESDVVTMVKGLMSVEDGEEDDDGKDELMSEETRRTLQDAAVKAQLRKKQTLETDAETSVEAKETSLDDETDESKQKFMAYLSKISAKIELHKKNVREEKKRKRRQRKQAASEKRQPTSVTARFLEDPDLEDEVDFLSRCGLKNQSDTLRFSRLMVRAKLIPTRLNLLAILRAGELPCRRLFLDYHGLHLLHGWINEDGRTDMTLRMALLETLESLPIANKTILTDSKVYQAIRSWCNSETLATGSTSTAEEGNSTSPSDESSKESAEKQTANVAAEVASADGAKTELEKLALKLLNLWDNLPEIFRIPKRERIEQMKEHEREADRQYAATVEAASDEIEQREVGTDRYQRDRFERRFGRPQGARTITVLGGGGATGLSSKRSMNSDVISPEDTKHLSKEQRRELFAAKVARDEAEKLQAERRREFETKCSFFGLDPLNTRAEDMPFCVSDVGKWYNERRQLIATPPAFAHVQTPVKPMSTNPTDYYLPSAATKLPPEWTFAINEQGKIYYYHLKHRIPQWEPPTPEQINKTKWSDNESESDGDVVGDGAEKLSEERIKEIEAIETQEDLNAYLKKIVQEQRQARYKRLVDERPISPRKEEDRIYNQIEMRKYKENKEKIKKRKEEIRRRRSEAIKSTMLNMCTLGSLDDKPSTSAAAVGASSTDNTKTDADGDSDLPNDALPIQDYLLSSDEENDIDEMKAECNNSPLLDKIVQGDKIVDELDALTTKRPLKRALPPHREINFDLNLSSTSGSGIAIIDENLMLNMEKLEHKKRKQEKKDKSKRSKESSDAKYRRLKEKFRCEIAGIIVHHLKPYRKDSCIFGRIKSNEDFNHLAKKLTHFVMIKELKYCESVGQTLVVTESVKNKSREFIRKYMAKYEAGYVKPDNDPEFKDIPYTL